MPRTSTGRRSMKLREERRRVRRRSSLRISTHGSQVTLDGVAIKPAFALGGWAAFKPAHGGAMVMGDLVLLEGRNQSGHDQADRERDRNHRRPQSSSAGIPATFYMHVGGHGDPVKMIAAVRAALAESKTPLTAPARCRLPPAIDLDTAQIDQIIGAKGQPNGGVYQFGVPRRDPITEDGTHLDPVGPLGVATASISSLPEGARPRSQATSFCLGAKSIRSSRRCGRTASR